MSEQSSRPEAPARARLVAVVGNPRPGSRTAALATSLARAIAEVAWSVGPVGSAGLGVAGSALDPVVLDLADLTEQLGPPLGSGSADRWAEPLRLLHAADLLVIATPTYKGSYTGLLKSFLDHVGGGALHGITAVPVTTVGSPAHTLAADVHLRPLLLELGASTPTAALVVGNDQIDDPASAIKPWLEANREVLRRALAPAPDASTSPDSSGGVTS